MCGICGVWYFDPERKVEPQLLGSMSHQLIHRGPDEGGQHIEGSLGLGFRRLSIIDLEGSHQPMANEDGSVWIVFNGEIYNFQDLRSRLISSHSFNTSGDTETILHAYEDFGAHCVQHLRGMFAFAVWDRHADQITFAVDRFGKKPLYYLLDHEKCIFGSELKAILQHPNLTLDIDYEALDQYLAYGYIAAPYSIFRQIRKLPPGHTAVIRRDGSLHLENYWHPHLCTPKQYDSRSIDDLAAELRALLTEAVRIRMISDVPLGAFLSGGVDSSAVVALMSEVSDQPVKTFSIGFEEDRFDESSYAQLVADYCKTDHTCDVVRPDIINILPKLIHQYDEPFADSSMIPTFYVSQATRQHVTVALSGDGGDEVFAGYTGYRYAFRQQFLKTFIPQSLRPVAAQVGRMIPSFAKIGPYLRTVGESAQYWVMRTEHFGPDQRNQLYIPDLRPNLNGAGSYPGERLRQEALKRASNLDWLSQFQYADLTVYMPGDILVKVDRASMLTSLEVRSPLLDHVVFEFMAAVPPRYKLNPYDSKILFKKALGTLLPPAIHTRHKQGFSIPLREWLAGPLRSLLRDTLLDATARNRGMFDLRYIENLIKEHVSGESDHKHKLWALLCFELWAREYLRAVNVISETV